MKEQWKNNKHTSCFTNELIGIGIPQTDLGGFIFETPNKNLGILRIVCTCEWTFRVENFTRVCNT